MDHYDDIVLNSPTRLELVEDCYAEIINFLGEENMPDPEYFLQVSCLLKGTSTKKQGKKR